MKVLVVCRGQDPRPAKTGRCGAARVRGFRPSGGLVIFPPGTQGLRRGLSILRRFAAGDEQTRAVEHGFRTHICQRRADAGQPAKTRKRKVPRLRFAALGMTDLLWSKHSRSR